MLRGFWSKDRKKFLLALVVLAAGMFLLTPRFFEMGPETWRGWKAALILRDTGAFPLLSIGPLYYIYLIPFLGMDYRAACYVEYAITFLFVYSALFLFFRRYLSFITALCLTCAWIQILGVVDHGYALGVGFLALHFSLPERSPFRTMILPPWLLFAFLCHGGTLFFLVGHAVGMLLERWKRWRDAKKPWFDVPVWSAPSVMSGFACLILALVLLLPSHRADNDPNMTHMAYGPRTSSSHLATAVMQHVVEAYYTKNHAHTPPSCDHEYEATYSECFGNARTLAQALPSHAGLIIGHMAENLRGLRAAVTQLVFGFSVFSFIPPWSYKFVVVAAFLLAFAGAGAYLAARVAAAELAAAFSFVGGTGAFVAFLLLTVLGSWRYTIVLLPVICICLFHAGDAAGWLLSRGRKRPLSGTGVREGLFMALAVFLFVQFFFTPASTYGWREHARALVSGDGLLTAGRPEFPSGSQISYMKAYPELFALISPRARVLSAEAQWVSAFTRAGLDVFSPYDLPCSALTPELKAFLGSMDVILLNFNWGEAPQGLGQISYYLRYEKLLRPFLDEEVAAGRWVEKDVAYFGRAYVKQHAQRH